MPHIHVDYVYLAVAPTTRAGAAAAHQVRWFTADELAMASGIADDSRLQATDLFTRVNSLPPSPSTAPARTDAEVGAATKSQNTRLIVLRGNSASGKSSVAAGIRDRYGRGIAIVAQDNLRRTVLRERDIPDGANISLISQVARFALHADYHVIIEGILYAAHYGPMLQELKDSHTGPSHLYYFDVPFEETLRRHARKPQAHEYGRAEMSTWYRDNDLLPGGIEDIIPEDSTLDDTVQRILDDTGLAKPPQAP